MFKPKVDKAIADVVAKKIAELEAEKSNWMVHWKEIAELFNPIKDNVWGGQTAGEKKHQSIIDSIGITCAQRLTDFIHGTIFNQTQPLIALTTTDNLLDTTDSVAKWLEEIEKMVHLTLFNSNFSCESHEVIHDLVTLQTSMLTIEEDGESIVRFESRPIYECNAIEDYRGLVEGVTFETNRTASQLMEEYGPVLHEDITQAAEREPIRKFTVQIYVDKTVNMPKEYQHSMMPYSSIHIVKEKSLIVKASGYHEKPFAVTRFKKLSGEKYGRGPSMAALPDVKTCNNMMKTWIMGAELAILPPLQAPDEGVLLPLKLVPAGMNYYRADSKDRVEPIITGGDPRIGKDIIEYLHMKIEKTFYLDQIHLVENSRMTTTEVMTRNDEAYRVFGPFFNRFELEYLAPAVVRTLGIMSRKGMLPPMPAEMFESGKPLEIKFLSMIKKAQQSVDAEAILRSFQSVKQMAEIDGTVMDTLDLDAHVKLLYKSYSAPLLLLRGTGEVEQIRQERAQMQAEQAAAQTGEADARAANQNAQADRASAEAQGQLQ